MLESFMRSALFLELATASVRQLWPRLIIV